MRDGDRERQMKREGGGGRDEEGGRERKPSAIQQRAILPMSQVPPPPPLVIHPVAVRDIINPNSSTPPIRTTFGPQVYGPTVWF